MKKKFFTIGLITLLVVGTISSIAFSQGFGRWGRGSGPGSVYGPRWSQMGSNLTEEQEEKLQSLRTDLDKEILPLRDKIQAKALELQRLWTADELDEKAILAKAKEVSDLQNQLQDKIIRYRLNTAKILTKEQRTLFSPAYGCGLPGCGYGGQFGMARGRWNW